MTRWPRFAWFTLLAILLSGGLMYLLLNFWISEMPLVERYDMPAYWRVSVLPVSFWKSYTLVTHNGHLAMPEEEGMFRLEHKQMDAKLLKTWLNLWVYHGSVWWVLRYPLALSWLLALGLCIYGRRLDQRYRSEARDGRNLRGPDLVSAAQWNRRIKRKDRTFYIESR